MCTSWPLTVWSTPTTATFRMLLTFFWMSGRSLFTRRWWRRTDLLFSMFLVVMTAVAVVMTLASRSTSWAASTLFIPFFPLIFRTRTSRSLYCRRGALFLRRYICNTSAGLFIFEMNNAVFSMFFAGFHIFEIFAAYTGKTFTMWSEMFGVEDLFRKFFTAFFTFEDVLITGVPLFTISFYVYFYIICACKSILTQLTSMSFWIFFILLIFV